MNFDWTNIALLIAVVYGFTNAIKVATKEKLGYWYMLIAVALGFGMVYFAQYAPDIIKTGLLVGAAASGIYDFRQGNK